MFRFVKDNNKGITLLSLIITIIVLSILASITLATLSSDNGIIKKAEEAKNATESSSSKEQQTVANILGYVNNIGGDNSSGGDSGGVGSHTCVEGEGTTTLAATCTNTGIKTYSCTICGAVIRTEVIPSTGHNYKGVVTTPATDTTDGVMTYTCENCGDSYPAAIPATGGTTHTCSFTEQRTDSAYLKTSATCTSPAIYYYSCSCGIIGSTTFTYGSASSHSYIARVRSSKTLRTAATCTEDATYWFVCNWCSSVSSLTYWTDTGTATGSHSYDSTTGICTDCGTECSHTGYGSCICGICGYDLGHETGTLYIYSKSSTGHVWASTCGLCGKEYIIPGEEAHNFVGGKCESCGYVNSGYYESCTHSWDDDGVCTNCDYACPHSSTTVTGYTYIDGATHGVSEFCNTCNASLVGTREGHTPGTGLYGDSSTCTECGGTISLPGSDAEAGEGV